MTLFSWDGNSNHIGLSKTRELPTDTCFGWLPAYLCQAQVGKGAYPCLSPPDISGCPGQIPPSARYLHVHT